MSPALNRAAGMSLPALAASALLLLSAAAGVSGADGRSFAAGSQAYCLYCLGTSNRMVCVAQGSPCTVGKCSSQAHAVALTRASGALNGSTHGIHTGAAMPNPPQSTSLSRTRAALALPTSGSASTRHQGSTCRTRWMAAPSTAPSPSPSPQSAHTRSPAAASSSPISAPWWIAPRARRAWRRCGSGSWRWWLQRLPCRLLCCRPAAVSQSLSPCDHHHFA